MGVPGCSLRLCRDFGQCAIDSAEDMQGNFYAGFAVSLDCDDISFAQIVILHVSLDCLRVKYGAGHGHDPIASVTVWTPQLCCLLYTTHNDCMQCRAARSRLTPGMLLVSVVVSDFVCLSEVGFEVRGVVTDDIVAIVSIHEVNPPVSLLTFGIDTHI